mmetsp:Transcript_10750/g.15721  ORF Transcript_10750/g.15721 Transcript_10750/m.15721 type:complete len:125 (+) Transcript_10750:382-756(+)
MTNYEYCCDDIQDQNQEIYQDFQEDIRSGNHARAKAEYEQEKKALIEARHWSRAESGRNSFRIWKSPNIAEQEVMSNYRLKEIKEFIPFLWSHVSFIGRKPEDQGTTLKASADLLPRLCWCLNC